MIYINQGKFIVFEGIDHCGKTVMIDALKRYVRQNLPDKKIIFTREPGGFDDKFVDQIREILLNPENDICPEAEAYLYAANRAQHTRQMKKYLEQGYTVICDRYYHSSLAYQGVGRGLGIENVLELNKLAIQGAVPSHIFYIQINLQTYLIRKSLIKSLDRLEKEKVDFFEKVLGYYETMSNKTNVYKINNDDRTLDATAEEVIAKFIEITKEDN